MIVKIATLEDFLRTYSRRTQERAKLYKKVIYLRETYGYGSKKISKIVDVPRSKLEGWVYGHKVPRAIRAINILSKLGFQIPLKVDNNPKFELFVKLFAFAFGDGGISTNFHSYFSGDSQDLLQLKREIRQIINLPSKIVKIQQTSSIGNREIKGTSYILVIRGKGNISLGRLLASAGAPVGDKVVKKYQIPIWVMKGPKWVKKLFLEVLMGNELTTPVLDKTRKNSISSIAFIQVKIEEYKHHLRRFLNQTRKLLREFDIETSIVKEIKSRKDRTKDDKFSCPMYFQIKKESTNVLNLHRIFQLRYASNKQATFDRTIKRFSSGLRTELIKNKLYFKALKLAKGGLGCRRIAKRLGIPTQYRMIDGWLNASQKPEYFGKRKELTKILRNTII